MKTPRFIVRARDPNVYYIGWTNWWLQVLSCSNQVLWSKICVVTSVVSPRAFFGNNFKGEDWENVSRTGLSKGFEVLVGPKLPFTSQPQIHRS